MTKKKYNNDSNVFADWTTKKLKQYAKEYYDLIYGENPCYGRRDLMMLDGVLNELYNRGIEPRKGISF